MHACGVLNERLHCCVCTILVHGWVWFMQDLTTKILSVKICSRAEFNLILENFRLYDMSWVSIMWYKIGSLFKGPWPVDALFAVHKADQVVIRQRVVSNRIGTVLVGLIGKVTTNQPHHCQFVNI